MMKSRFSSLSAANSRGNVLFMIMIAVALFAALTMAITKSNQGGSNNLNRERGTINASDVMSYGSSMEKTVARLLSNEISESGLSFENANWQYNDNSQVETAAMFANCTSSRCKVFDLSGGGLTAQVFGGQEVASPVATDIKSGHAGVYALKVAGVGSAAQDLVLMIAVIDVNTCLGINNSLKITNPSNSPPEDSWGGAVLYNGSFSSANDASGEIGDAATQIAGKSSGCIRRSGGAYGGADNYFYQVLLPR